MRNAFADEITNLAARDERVVLLSGDIGNKLFDRFKLAAPGRFFNCGVAEANMMGMAAGMALSGLRPFVYTIAPFTTTRCYEQIRVDVCYHEAPVVIVGAGAGLSYAELGPTHHALEDLAILRALPGIDVLAPCDAVELRALLGCAFASGRPAYLRIGKKGEAAVHAAPAGIGIGRFVELRAGSDVCLLAAGTVVPLALEAAALLEAQGVSATVASCPSVKPLDEAYLADAAIRHRLLVTVEEHGRIGGFGGAVAEWLAQRHPATPLRILGTADAFMHEVGSQDYARRKFGLTAADIAAAALPQEDGTRC